MKSVALLTLGLLAVCCPAIARSHHGHHFAARTVHHANVAHRANAADVPASHVGITCEMVRAYVAQVGLTQAMAIAVSAGMTPSEKDQARRCLAQKS